MPLVLSGDGAVGPLSATEVSYLDGVTSAVQTQLNGKVTTPGAWAAFTPSWTNLTVGNAANLGSYAQIGKTVFVSYVLNWGSTTTASGIFYPALPVAAASSNYVGSGWLFDTSASVFNSCVFVPDKYILAPTAGRVNDTVPWTWANGDYVRLTLTYEAA